MSQRILVTGASGFVGTYLRAAIAARWPDAEVTALTSPEEVCEGFVAIDLLDRLSLDSAVAEVRPTIVIHLAAQASVALSMPDNGATFAVNVGGSLNLALAVARHAPTATLLFVSSSEVYGESFHAGPVSDESPTLPLNDYARSKLLAEDVFRAVLPPSARLIITRPFSHTGPGQRDVFVLPSIAAQITRIEAGWQKSLLVGNLDVRRDMLDVRDIVEAYLCLLDVASDLPPRFTCNVSSESSPPLRQRVDAMCSFARVSIEIVVDPARLRPRDVPVMQGTSSRLRAATGWRPQIPIESTLAELLDHARRKGEDEFRIARQSIRSGVAPYDMR